MPDHPNPKRLLPVIIAYLHVFSSVDAILKLKLNSISESTTYPRVPLGTIILLFNYVLYVIGTRNRRLLHGVNQSVVVVVARDHFPATPFC